MAKGMKSVKAPVREPTTLTIKIDPLARGAMKVRRGGPHATAKHANRAANKRSWMSDGLLV